MAYPDFRKRLPALYGNGVPGEAAVKVCGVSNVEARGGFLQDVGV